MLLLLPRENIVNASGDEVIVETTSNSKESKTNVSNEREFVSDFQGYDEPEACSTAIGISADYNSMKIDGQYAIHADRSLIATRKGNSEFSAVYAVLAIIFLLTSVAVARRLACIRSKITRTRDLDGIRASEVGKPWIVLSSSGKMPRFFGQGTPVRSLRNLLPPPQ